MQSNDEILTPNFDLITDLCMQELRIKFPEYGNSWVKDDTNYWFKRIENEVEEYKKSMTPISARRKLLNIINMSAMAFDNLKEGRMEHIPID